MSTYAFDFFGTLDTHAWVRLKARELLAAGHEIHIVSAISPGLPFDNDESYAKALNALNVPFTAIHRVDHDPALKVEVLKKINAAGFWDDVYENVAAAKAAGFTATLVGEAFRAPETQACPVCGGKAFIQRKILWPALVVGWGLTASEEATIERQQGVHCTTCGCNLRAMALGQALMGAFNFSRGGSGALAEGLVSRPFDKHNPLAFVMVLEVNPAGALTPILAKLPGHKLVKWPDVDLRALPFEPETFDVVVHSDTLEHIPDADGVFPPMTGFTKALHECHRVLRPGGALCFTVPTLIGKMTRSTLGRPPTYHGPDGDENLRVHTEFGADVWAYVLAAGFSRCEFTCIEYPAGLAITAWK